MRGAGATLVALALSILVAVSPALADGLRAEWIAEGGATYRSPLPVRPHAAVRALMGDQWLVVDMPEGGRLAFDVFQLPEGATAAGDVTNQIILRQIKASTFLRARLTPRQLAILDNVKMVTTPDPLIRASAMEEGGEYTIEFSNGISFFAEQMGALRARNLGDLTGAQEELILMIGSEFDSQRGRGRWYWPSLYAWFRGRTIDRNSVGLGNLASIYKQEALRAATLHEFCHLIAGDGSIDARVALGELYQAGKFEEYGRVAQARELDADRCAAKHLAASGSEPGGTLLFLILMDMLRFEIDLDHPSVMDRVGQLEDLTEAALAEAKAEGFPPEEIEQYRNALKSLDAAKVDLKALATALDDAPRGIWPQCPFMPTTTACR